MWLNIHIIKTLNCILVLIILNLCSCQLFDVILEKEIENKLIGKNYKDNYETYEEQEKKNKENESRKMINFLQIKIEKEEKVIEEMNSNLNQNDKYEDSEKLFEIKKKVENIENEINFLSLENAVIKKMIDKIDNNNTHLTVTNQINTAFKNIEPLQTKLQNLRLRVDNMKNRSGLNSKFLKLDITNKLDANKTIFNTIFMHEFEANQKIRFSKIDNLIEIENKEFELAVKSGDYKITYKMRNLIKLSNSMQHLTSYCGEFFDRCFTSDEETKNKKDEIVK